MDKIEQNWTLQKKLDNKDKTVPGGQNWTIWTKNWKIWTKLANVDKNWTKWTRIGQNNTNWTKWTKLDYKNKSGHKLDIKCMIHNR